MVVTMKSETFFDNKKREEVLSFQKGCRFLYDNLSEKEQEGVFFLLDSNEKNFSYYVISSFQKNYSQMIRLFRIKNGFLETTVMVKPVFKDGVVEINKEIYPDFDTYFENDRIHYWSKVINLKLFKKYVLKPYKCTVREAFENFYWARY